MDLKNLEYCVPFFTKVKMQFLPTQAANKNFRPNKADTTDKCNLVITAEI